MFTGLIEATGTVLQVDMQPETRTRLLRVDLSQLPDDGEACKAGDSIAVNGCCLTIAEWESGSHAAFQLTNETWERTAFARIDVGMSVNLERALKVGQRLGGHWVTGHVDGVGTVLDRRPDDESHRLIVSMPRDCRPFLAPRGSIAIQGVSLTVTAVSSSQFEVVLIPYTCQHTTLGHLVTGAFVNLEVDILARYTLANANVTQPLHPAFHEHA